MNPIFLKFGIFEIRWYSIFILTGFILGFILVYKQKNKLNLSKKELLDLIFYLIIICIIGARLYYCVFNLEYYFSYPLDIIKVWEGGLAIHGGVLFGICYLGIYTFRKKQNIFKFTDVFAPALAIGQAIGRWGNFFNSEAYGSVTTLKNLQSMHIPKFIIDGMHIGKFYYHPTFLYESVWCLIIFVILLIITNFKPKKIGLITSIYLMLYGIERFFIEGMRLDSLMFFNIRIAQLVSILMIVAGIIIFIISIRGNKNYDK